MTSPSRPHLSKLKTIIPMSGNMSIRKPGKCFLAVRVNLTYIVPVSIVNLVEVRSENAFSSVFIAILCLMSL